MNRWERRVLGILALGGSFLGLVLGGTVMLSHASYLARVFAVPFLALYVWGIWCGLRMIEESESALKANAWFWAIQVPYFMSPIAGYYFSSGSMLYVTYEPGVSNVRMLCRFGSQFRYSLLQTEQPFVFGVNLLALAILLWLIYRIFRRKPLVTQSDGCDARAAGFGH